MTTTESPAAASAPFPVDPLIKRRLADARLQRLRAMGALVAELTNLQSITTLALGGGMSIRLDHADTVRVCEAALLSKIRDHERDPGAEPLSAAMSLVDAWLSRYSGKHKAPAMQDAGGPSTPSPGKKK